MREAELNDSVLKGHLMTMRIITFALVMGLLTFLGIAVYLVQDNGPMNPQPVPFLTYFGLGFFLLQVILAAIVPPMVANNRLSVSNCRISRGRVAPSDWRTESSF